MNPLVFAAGCLAAGVWAFAPPAAHSQAYPSKPVRMIVSVMGGVDAFARLMARKMGESLGQPVVVENRVGANGFIASEFVARASPDGYTILVSTSSTMAIGPYLVKHVPFDPVKDFTPITLAYAGMAMVVVHATVPVNSLKELIEFARRNPGKLTYASNGTGSNFHLIGEQLKQAVGMDILHVPYKSGGEWFRDLFIGRIDLGFPSLDNFRPFLSSGKVKVLAVAEAKRHPQLPDAPTVAELVPGFEKPPSWIALFAPAKLPQPLLARLHSVTLDSLRSPDVSGKLEGGGYTIIGNRPEEAAAILKRDLERTARLVKAIGIEPE